MLDVEKLTVKYGALTVVDGVSFSVRPGEWLVVAGPNGAGKSTIVKAIAQGVPYSGRVLLGGQDLACMKPQLAARQMGLLSQNHYVGYAFTVEEVVRLGRYAHALGPFSARTSKEDSMAVDAALEMVGLSAQRRQSVLTLSGGELQRTFLAQLFAQAPPLLILDEPANHLDLAYLKQVLGLIGDWLKGPGRAVISVVHDLSLARAYGTSALLLNKGRLVAQGPVGQVLTRQNLASVYGMDVFEWMRSMHAQWQ